MNKDLYIEKTKKFVMPIIDELGLELFDVEFVKEGGEYILRVYIDKPGGVTIDDCVAVTKPMNEILDKEDYVSESYIFEVSSPGIDAKRN